MSISCSLSGESHLSPLEVSRLGEHYLTVYKTHKLRLDPNKSQEELFWKCIGVARFTYNWGLEQWKKDFDDGGKPNKFELIRRLNAWKRTDFPWMMEVPKNVYQEALINLGAAFEMFFRGKSKYPNFKTKRCSKQRARLDNGFGHFRFKGKKIVPNFIVNYGFGFWVSGTIGS